MNTRPPSRSGRTGRDLDISSEERSSEQRSLPEARSFPEARPESAVEAISLPAARALAMAELRLETARRRRLAYRGRSEHMRRKLDAAMRAAESDVAILRYALAGTDSPDRVENG